MKTKITILTAVLLLAGAIGSANAAGGFSAGSGGGGDRPSGPSDISDKPGGGGPSGPGDFTDKPGGGSSGPGGKVSSDNSGATEDKYCKNGSSKFPDCNTKFIQDCKAAGGNMSGQQGWGGKTCREPS